MKTTWRIKREENSAVERERKKKKKTQIPKYIKLVKTVNMSTRDSFVLPRDI